MNPIGIVFRRIIYAIPLKVLLLLLAVFGVLFACFSNADTIESVEISPFAVWDKYVDSHDSYSTINSAGDVLCVQSHSSACNSVTVTFSNGDSFSGNPYFGSDLQNQNILCGVGGAGTFSVTNNTSSYCQFYMLRFTWSELVNTTMCQTEYNLIPISSVDQNYCTTNNLCPSVDCPEIPDNPNIGTSNIYINDIFHPGAFNVIMNIPEEIDWDYAYTNSGQNFNIDVVGYNQDFEKIEGWIETNNYKPTSEDFTKIFTSFSSFGGLLIACLFVILVFYFVKKMFK